MSWAAHELESLILYRHIRVTWRISYIAVLIGALLPDFTKLPAYGVHIGGLTLVQTEQPWLYHRGWPGVGPTHSLMFGVVVAVPAVYLTSRSAPWAVGLLAGIWSHVLSDVGDSAGTMLFFPFTTQHYSIGMWRYSAQEGHLGDAASYYSGMGFVFDLVWLAILLLFAHAALGNRYFHDEVESADPMWRWLQRRLRLPDHVRRVLYRAFVVYGACRVLGWFLWARFVNPLRGIQRFDLTWGGPEWVTAAPRLNGATTWPGTIAATLFGAAGVTVSCWAALNFARWWTRRSLTAAAMSTAAEVDA